MTLSSNNFKALVQQTAGFDTNYHWPMSIEKGIQAMMQQLKLSDPQTLYQKLMQSPDLLYDFIQQFTINESYFNREPMLLETVASNLVPELLIESQHEKHINVLSAGCSTGEEPYSIAIAMIERYGDGCWKMFDFYAIDIDIEAIMTATQGIYNSRSVHMLDQRILQTHFYPINNSHYQLKKDIRNQVNFYRMPLQKVKHFFTVPQMDIIFYRNVSIYFDPQTRQSIFNHLSDILRPGGYLIMSPTETFAHDFKRLALIEKQGFFVFQNKKQSTESLFAHQPIVNESQKKSLLQCKSLNHVVELASRKRYEFALNQLDEYMNDNDDLQAHVLKACILINQYQLSQVRAICQEIHQKDRLNEAAFLLLGQVDRLENHLKKAQFNFSQVLNINPQNWLAHYFLAKIYEDFSDRHHAIDAYKAVIKLINIGKFTAHGLLFFPLSFTMSDIMFLCQKRLEMLE